MTRRFIPLLIALGVAGCADNPATDDGISAGTTGVPGTSTGVAAATSTGITATTGNFRNARSAWPS